MTDFEFNGTTVYDARPGEEFAKLPCDQAQMLRFHDALLSGDYPQGTGLLLTAMGGYCCLGVATDLAVKDGIGRWDQRSFTGDNVTFESEILPWQVAARLGLVNDNRLILGWRDDGEEVTGVWLNDEGATFAEIAGRIKTMYLDPEPVTS